MGRREKVCIIFDEQKRKDYLTGFRKRKQERRAKALLENENKLKEEVRNVKQAYHNELMRKLENVTLPNFIADDLNVVSKRTTTDAGEHTVSIEEINIAQSHYFMGENAKGNVDLKPESTTNFGNVTLKKALKMNPRNFLWKKRKRAPHAASNGRKKMKKTGRRKVTGPNAV
ncbi:Nucleolar protein [Echinococcus granulosus]|uniref:Nucleolar protein 12 n=1 Tax=Echinococcus granulosus TaxID=6210 RepID=W6UKJ9_ECHGR|nr:Nucleolar protein [Echinococcus granulosus]EUB61608.1 Nucleolar protein [Echinococcus granulosus]